MRTGIRSVLFTVLKSASNYRAKQAEKYALKEGKEGGGKACYLAASDRRKEGGVEVQREKGRGQESEAKSSKGDGKQKALIWWVKLYECHYPELRRSRLRGLNSAGAGGPHPLRLQGHRKGLNE